MSIKILLVDNHTLICEALQSKFKEITEITIIAKAEDGLTALELVRKHVPDIVITEIDLPDFSGIELTHKLQLEFPEIKVVALSNNSNSQIVCEMMKAGASGYLLKETHFDELTDAIYLIMNGKNYVSPCLAGKIMKDCPYTYPPPEKSLLSCLNDRELQVLKLMVRGKEIKEIAGVLNRDVDTIYVNKKHIMEKLGSKNSLELIKIALQAGVT